MVENNTFPILDIIHENLHFTPSAKHVTPSVSQISKPTSRNSEGGRYIITPTIDERKTRVVYRRGSVKAHQDDVEKKLMTNFKDRIGELRGMSKIAERDTTSYEAANLNPAAGKTIGAQCTCRDPDRSTGNDRIESNEVVENCLGLNSRKNDHCPSDLKNVFIANGCRRLYEIQRRHRGDFSAESIEKRSQTSPKSNDKHNKSEIRLNGQLSCSDGSDSTSCRHGFGRSPLKLPDNKYMFHSLLKAYYNQSYYRKYQNSGTRFYRQPSRPNFYLSDSSSFPEHDIDDDLFQCKDEFCCSRASTPDDLESFSIEEYHLGALHEGWKKYLLLGRLFTCWQPLEGQLSKYTNVMKGWQFRWFVLNPEQGKLEYFEKEEHRKILRPSRGSIMLAGAVICPSDEDSQTFIVNAANGEVYRLKAFDAKERQHWVNRLRATAEYHIDFMPYSKATEHLSLLSEMGHGGSSVVSGSKPETLIQPAISCASFQSSFFSRQPAFHIPFKSQSKLSQAVTSCLSTPPYMSNDTCHATVTSSIKNCAQQLSFVHDYANALHSKIEELPSSGNLLHALDKELLLLKASSSSTLTCLQQCLHILQYQASQSSATFGDVHHGMGEMISTDEISKHLSPLQEGSQSKSPTDREAFEKSELQLKYKKAIEDVEIYSDTDLGAVDEHKSIILNLLSQLKLGMDLTKVVLPTFILERRSLLEMFADCMAHPDLFLSISDQPTPEARMLNVFEWYLTSFHAARQGAIAKKPYNPIIGETFHCMWSVDDENINDDGVKFFNSPSEVTKCCKLYYCAEQVSHHPPVSAFYFECPEKGISMEASIWTRSKFMGMSVGVMMIGKIRLRLLKYDEEYEFSLPSAYARSILTVPWVELGDKVNIQCEKTGCSAGIVFHTKPFYGGKLHKITAEVKNSSGEFICHVLGEWNGILEFSYVNGQSKTVNTSKLAVKKKCVRPITEQGEKESRKLWLNVTESLKSGDVIEATQYKHLLEEEQRKIENVRRENQLPIPMKVKKI